MGRPNVLLPCGRRHSDRHDHDGHHYGADSADDRDRTDEHRNVDHDDRAGADPPDPVDHTRRAEPEGASGDDRRTICKAGWTAKVRPKPSYTTALKIRQMPLYEEGGPTSDYEEDHFVPLELGGAPRNPKNLWPEPRSQADVSDPLETALKHRVCSHLMTLAQARAEIRTFKNENG